jgi:hypothetical protein
MIFIIDLAIAVGIWVPFTMGKTTALLFVSERLILYLIMAIKTNKMHFPVTTRRYTRPCSIPYLSSAHNDGSHSGRIIVPS